MKLGPELICLLLKKKSIKKYIKELRINGNNITITVEIPRGYEKIKECLQAYETRG